MKTGDRCSATHNPGRWPYIARCVKTVPHVKHRDRDGNEWETEE